MKKLSIEQMENIEGGKFIGVETNCSEVMGTEVCSCHFDFVWIRLGSNWSC
jgi:bacteriocin-like protein